jgi:hypothetical protein
LERLLNWTPHPRQVEALSRQEREILYGGSRGGGKTACGTAWLCEPEYISNKRFRGLVIRKSFKDLADWIARARAMMHGMAEIFTMPAEIRFKSGAVVALGHWGDPSAVSMYLGQEYQKILIEELTDIFPDENDYLKLLGSLRSSDPTLRPQVFATTNPGGPGHSWVKKRWVDVAYNKTYYDPNSGHTRIFIPSKVDDNPSLMTNDPEYVRYLDTLPERLRRAWRDGSWELSEGAFFTEFQPDLMKEPAFQIDETTSHQRLFGSLDIGASHHTSFGLWYVSPDGCIHRMMTYCMQLSSIRDHAREIYDQVASHRPTKGYFPKTVWVGKDAWTKSKLNEFNWRSPIDEYEEIWNIQGRQSVVFEPANDSRANGCMIMQDLFKARNGKPQAFYLDQYNKQYEEAVPSVMINSNKPEEYLKTSNWTDDLVDEARYGLVGIYTWLTGEKRAKQMRAQAMQYNQAQTQLDWYNQ